MRSARFLAASTIARILMTPMVMALLAIDGPEPSALSMVAAVIFAIAAATDFFDGYFARRWDVTTKLGSFLDTTADKLLVAGVLIALVAVDRVSLWIAFIIVGRELVLMGLRGVIASEEGTVMVPSFLGRLKTLIQFVAITLACWRPGEPVAGLFVDEWVMIAAAVITVASAADYLRRSAHLLTLPPTETRP